ncbi:MAG: lactate utilization protein [Clostridiales bacterium]|nr:lactate utilization protein [Candidatus Equinaster intestinalis]
MEKLLKNLANNNMEAYFVKTKGEIVPLVKKLINKGDTISCGGSVTLAECGVADLMKSGDYNFLDRAVCRTPEEITEIYRKTYSADAFFCSANAVTENGELYMVDGRANRISAVLHGPESVICIVGKNKIVPDFKAAVKRVKTVAAPKNAKRLNMKTPCAVTGVCCMPDGEPGTGCKCEDRICADFVLLSQQMIKNRIKVIICGEELGY